MCSAKNHDKSAFLPQVAMSTATQRIYIQEIGKELRRGILCIVIGKQQHVPNHRRCLAYANHQSSHNA